MKIKITRDHVKTVSTFVVGRAVQGVVTTIIQNNTDPQTRMQTASVHVASYAIGSMVADAAKDHTDKKIDEFADAIEKIKNDSKVHNITSL